MNILPNATWINHFPEELPTGSVILQNSVNKNNLSPLRFTPFHFPPRGEPSIKNKPGGLV